MNERFDALAKQLGAQHNRRGMITAAAAGTLALLGLSTLRDDAAAENRTCRKDNDCKRDQVCNKQGTQRRCRKSDEKCTCHREKKNQNN